MNMSLLERFPKFHFLQLQRESVRACIHVNVFAVFLWTWQWSVNLSSSCPPPFSYPLQCTLEGEHFLSPLILSLHYLSFLSHQGHSAGSHPFPPPTTTKSPRWGIVCCHLPLTLSHPIPFTSVPLFCYCCPRHTSIKQNKSVHLHMKQRKPTNLSMQMKKEDICSTN